ncbi:hypothetical protein KBB27_03955 [Patescibacteria group bacterium]|nr:hypothetical protein [Patescibacteria group bacterium]
MSTRPERPPSGSRELFYSPVDSHFDEDVLVDSIPSAYAEDASRNEKIHREVLSRFRAKLADLDAYSRRYEAEARDPLSAKFFYLHELLNALDDVSSIDDQPDFVNMVYDRISAIKPVVNGIDQGNREHLFDDILFSMKECLKDYLYQAYVYLNDAENRGPLNDSVNHLFRLLRITIAATKTGFSRESR